MTATAEGVCQVMSDRTPWWNFTIGAGITACVALIVCASIIALIRSRLAPYDPWLPA